MVDAKCGDYLVQVSIVDQRPEELLAAAALGVRVQYAAGLGASGSSSSLRFSVDSVQIDDDIPGTRCRPAARGHCMPASLRTSKRWDASFCLLHQTV